MDSKDLVQSLKSLGASREQARDVLRGADINLLDDAESLLEIFDDGSSIVDRISDSFTGLGESMSKTWSGIKSGFTGTVLPFLKTNWVAIAAGLAAVTIAMVAYSNSFENLANKAEKARSALQETTAELTSLQNEKAANQQEINRLSETAESRESNAKIIAQLERENNLLEAKIALQERQQDIDEQASAKAASAALTKMQDVETSWDQYEQKDFIDITASDMKKLDDYVEKRNDIADSIKEIEDAKKAEGRSDYTKDELRQLERLNWQAETYQGLIDELSPTLLDNQQKVVSFYESLYDSDGNVIKGYEQLVKRLESTFPDLLGVNQKSNVQKIIEDYRSQLSQFTAMSSTDKENLTSSMENWLNELGTDDQQIVFDLWFNSDGAIKSLADLQKAYENAKGVTSESLTGVSVATEKAAIESITAAINENNSATGLTAATVKSLKDRYSDLEAFNPEALFKNTASGIRLNSTYLAQLEKLMEASNQEKLAQKLYELSNKYNDLIAKKSEYLSQGKEDEWNTEVEALEDKIASVKQLQAEYAGLTNSYNDWLNAQSAPQSGDWHDTASERIKNLDELYREGLYGNTELQEGLEFFTNTDIAGIDDWEGRMNAVKAAYAQLDDVIPKTTHSLRDMMATGKQGGQAYLETLKQLGYATYDAANNSWTFSDNFDVGDIADAMNTTEEFVEMMNELLREYGFNINTNQAQMSAEELKQKLITLREKIDEINEKTIKPDVDTREAEQAIEVIKSLIAEMQGDGISAEQISNFAKELSNLDIPTLEGLGFNFDNIDIGNKGEIAKAIESQLPEVQIPATTTPTTTTLTAESELPQAEPVAATVDYELGTQAEPEGKTATVYYKWGGQAPPLPMTAQVIYIGGFGGAGASGTAHASGTAKANGDWGTAPGGKTLVGELGTEIVVDPHTGRWYTVGDYGAEFVDMPKDAIVFNHRQTESLLSQGSIVGRGKALAGGNAAAMIDRADSGGKKKPIQQIQQELTESGGSDGGPGTGSSGGSGGSSGGSGGGSGEEDGDRFDWIEILVERIERSIDNLAKIAESSYKALTKKLTASDDQIAKITEEIAIQEQARDLYLAEADEIDLEDYQKWRARDGYLKISNYDDDTTEKIEEYKELYDKSLEAEDKILELKETLAELHQDQFDYIQDDFDNQIEQIEHIITSYENGIDAIEERGLLGSASYYSALQNITQQNITLLNDELEQLTAAFDKAMATGEIEEGSEAWYEMKSSINDVREEIDDANLSLLEYANSIRQLNWDSFDYMLERIGRMANESEFLIDLMSNEKLFEDDGKFTEFADATTGLHAMNYNVYMSQADKYAEEIVKLNKEIAEDPYNTKLLARREELLDLQHDSILAAEDEKQAIVDLVEEGIDLELDALQELIDKYTDALDSAKDLYEYNNQINDQTSEISTLRKQLMVYENNTSEEGRAKAQSIRAELKEAEKALEETEYDKYIDDQKKMLDDLYTEYEEILNERLDNTNALIEEAVTNTNLNTESINQTITDAAADVGYTLTEGMQEVWNNSFAEIDSTIAIYGDGFSEKLTSINSVLDAIEDYVSAILVQSDAEAAKIINAKSVEGNVKFKTGGLADFTGLAQLDGTPQKPELVLNANDTKNFLELNDLLRSMASKGIQLGSSQNFGVDAMFHAVGFTDLSASIASIRSQPINTSTTFGDINITIPIDHVDDYNDFVNQLRDDRKFEEMIKGMTIGAITGENSLSKYKNIW